LCDLSAVAVTGIGVAAPRWNVEELISQQGIVIRYGLRQKLTNIEREVIDMDVLLRSAWLRSLRRYDADTKMANSMEASMCKLRGCGYPDRRKPLNWASVTAGLPAREMVSDAKITDIYEGTGQLPDRCSQRAWVYWSNCADLARSGVYCTRDVIHANNNARRLY
jgi:hypothetical protein